MYKFIETRKEENIGIITLNRPEKLNAWHKPMKDEFLDALKKFESDQNIRAIILTGAGDRGFCAGQDLEEAEKFDADGGEAWVVGFRVLYGFIRSLSKPLVGAINGTAAGSGFQLALLTDVRVGHAGTQMGQPEINNGITTSFGSWIMAPMIGLSRTIELTLTGRMMDGEECYRIGLLHTLVPQKDVMKEALKVAKDLASKPPIAMRLTKDRFREMTEESFQELQKAAVRMNRESYGSGEPQAIARRFLEKHAARK
jgi:enoyl-CoA hydratase/carnithine racemase